MRRLNTIPLLCSDGNTQVPRNTMSAGTQQDKIMYGFFRPDCSIQDIVSLEKHLDDTKFSLRVRDETETGKEPFHIVKEE